MAAIRIFGFFGRTGDRVAWLPRFVKPKMISYRYPIFPDKTTQQKLAEALDACRWLHNRLLQEINEAKEKGSKLKTYDTQNMIPSLKLENPKLNMVYSKVLQMVNYTLWSNIKGLSASKKNGRKIGHVRFKGYGWYKTMNYNQSGFKLDQDHGRLRLSKIGDIKIKMHRKVQGCIKAILIKREGRQWFNKQRSDFLHKLSRSYVNNYDIICVENLDVKGLKEKGQNKGTHRNIHDASWSKFIFMLSYKAESAGRKLIKVDPRNTTQRCSVCGSIVKKELSDRVHECTYCGFSCDRDYNASRNILIAGMEQPVEPIEPKPLCSISVAQVFAMNWEALPFRVG